MSKVGRTILYAGEVWVRQSELERALALLSSDDRLKVMFPDKAVAEGVGPNPKAIP